MPWPFSDRDVISHIVVAQDSTGVVTITKMVMPDYIPAKKDVVRITNFKSMYILTPLGGGKVQVELQMMVDPGGNIPAWLINSNIVLAPYQTTVGMNNQLPDYQQTHYSFIRERS